MKTLLYWTLSGNVFLLAACREKPAPQNFGPARFYVFAEPALALREEASQSAKELTAVPFGEAVSVETASGKEETSNGKAGSWVKTTYRGKSGYVFSGFLSPVPLPQTNCQNLLNYARSNFTAESAESRVYDDPANKGPYRWQQKFSGHITAEGYGSIDGGAMTLTLPVKDREIGFHICKRCTPHFRSLSYSAFEAQNGIVKECGRLTSQGGCLLLWTMESTFSENGLTVKCGADSI